MFANVVLSLSLSLSLCLFSSKVFIPYFCGGPFLIQSIISQPSICTFQGNHLDACPIRTFLEVVERAISCEITIHVSFPHICGQIYWCSVLNVEMAVIFPDISRFHCLHDFVVFPETLLFDARSYLKYSQGVFTPQDPRSADQSAFSPQTSHSQLSSVSE